MSDFIREVDEDYRRDRIMKFFSRFQVPLALLVVLIIAAAGGWRVWVDHKQASAEKDNALYDAADKLAKDGKDEQAQAAFESIAASGPAGYAMLARMRATESLAARDPEAAAKGYDAIANNEAIEPAMRDTARLRGAMLRIDREPAKAFEQRYGRFSIPGFAFNNSMRELLALSALKDNDIATAGKYLDAIIIDPTASSALRNRAEAFRALVTAGPATMMTTPAGPASVTPLVPDAAPQAPAPEAPAPQAPAPQAPAPAPPAPVAAPQPPAK